LLDAPINVVSVPQRFQLVLRHVAAGDEFHHPRRVFGRAFRQLQLKEQLLFGVEGDGRVVEAVLVAVGEDAPLDAGDGRVTEYLADPLLTEEPCPFSLTPALHPASISSGNGRLASSGRRRTR
jgi:hypothetical protein